MFAATNKRLFANAATKFQQSVLRNNKKQIFNASVAVAQKRNFAKNQILKNNEGDKLAHYPGAPKAEYTNELTFKNGFGDKPFPIFHVMNSAGTVVNEVCYNQVRKEVCEQFYHVNKAVLKFFFLT